MNLELTDYKPSFKTFLLKVSSFCNLNCKYCYEYNLSDSSYLSKPNIMSKEVLDKAVKRIADYINQEDVKVIRIIFHGGEPLLAPKEFYKYAVNHIKESIGIERKVKFGMQTNGTLLSQEWIDLFLELDIGAGISIDGVKEINDKNRLNKKGHSVFDEIVNSIKLITQPENQPSFGGVLTVIDVLSDPLETIKFLISLNIHHVDFLFPLNHYGNKPIGIFNKDEGYGYGKWLSIIFDYWWDNDIHTLKIRIFETIMHLLLDGKFSYESFGLSPVELAVIQTDGGYEAVDSLKSTYDGAVTSNMNVFEHSLKDVIAFPLIGQRLNKDEFLSETCKQCNYVRVCGGGYLPHRWDPDKEFDMPSIYCNDLKYLINHISHKLIIADEKYKQIIEAVLRPLYV